MKTKLLTGLLSAIAFAPAAALAQYYTATDLGLLAGSGSPAGHVSGMNDLGIIVGQDKTGSSTSFAFEYDALTNPSPGAGTSLGNIAGGANGLAYAVNDMDVVAGWVTTSGESSTTAFSDDGSAMTLLGTLGGANSEALALNNNGTIVGFSNPSGGGALHAFSYSSGVMTDLGTAGGTNSSAQAISKNGTIVGYSDLATGTTQAALFANGNVINLGTIGTSYPYSQATGVNNGGVVVGFAGNTPTTPSLVHAFIYKNAIMSDIGTLGTGSVNFASAVNKYGAVVGQSNLTSGGSTFDGYIHGSSGIADLNTLVALGGGVTLINAAAIDDLGRVLAVGSDHHAYFLTPTAGAVTHFAVSVPSSADPGTPFSVTLTALDAYNTPVTSAANTVHITSSDPGAALPGNTALVNGTATVSVTLNSSGGQVVKANDISAMSLKGTSGIVQVSGGPVSSGTPIFQGYGVS